MQPIVKDYEDQIPQTPKIQNSVEHSSRGKGQKDRVRHGKLSRHPTPGAGPQPGALPGRRARLKRAGSENGQKLPEQAGDPRQT